MTPSAGQNTTGLSPQRKELLPRHLMTDKEKALEWVRFYRGSKGNYEMRALIGCFKSDGLVVLRIALKELGLERSEDLVQDAIKRE